MKNKAFIVKVGDLLKEAGRKDEIIIKNKITDMISGLSDEGISVEIFLQSLSKDSVFVDLEHIECDINSVCDTCEADFIRSVFIDEYSGKFVLGEAAQKLEQEHSEEEIFPIHARDESLDIEEMLVQAVRLDEPIAIHCATCAQNLAEMPDEEEDTDYFEGNDNVSFH